MPPAKFANISSKSFVSFIKLIGLDSHQVESILNCDCAEQVKSFGNNLLEGLLFTINVQGLNLTPTLYCSGRNHIALKPTVT